jgi:5-methylcytosine-specific restriction endonuclease McrA
MAKRLEFSRKVRKHIIDRANGKCEKCNAALKPGEGDADHILPSELGGKAEAANGQWLCKVCHKAKTADDIRRIRKADRQRDKATGAVKPKGRMQSRDFEKTEKTRKIDKAAIDAASIAPKRRALFG